jgi:hypothetical protein
VHEDRRVLGDWQRTALVLVDERLVNDQETAGGEGVRRAGDEALDVTCVPVVEDVREEVDVVTGGPLAREEVAGDDAVAIRSTGAWSKTVARR